MRNLLERAKYCMCSQRVCMLLWSKWQQRGNNYREKKYSWKIIPKGNAAGLHFPFMINFVFQFIFSQALKVWRCLFQPPWQSLLDVPIASSTSLPCFLPMQNWNKITGSFFPFLDIHLLSDFFQKTRFHPASPTYAEGVTSVQWLTWEKAVGGCTYSICIMA